MNPDKKIDYSKAYGTKMSKMNVYDVLDSKIIGITSGSTFDELEEQIKQTKKNIKEIQKFVKDSAQNIDQIANQLIIETILKNNISLDNLNKDMINPDLVAEHIKNNTTGLSSKNKTDITNLITAYSKEKIEKHKILYKELKENSIEDISKDILENKIWQHIKNKDFITTNKLYNEIIPNAIDKLIKDNIAPNYKGNLSQKYKNNIIEIFKKEITETIQKQEGLEKQIIDEANKLTKPKLRKETEENWVSNPLYEKQDKNLKRSKSNPELTRKEAEKTPYMKKSNSNSNLTGNSQTTGKQKDEHKWIDNPEYKNKNDIKPKEKRKENFTETINSRKTDPITKKEKSESFSKDIKKQNSHDKDIQR